MCIAFILFVKPVLLLVNPFNWLKYQYTMQINRLKLGYIMLNRFNRLEHLYSMHIKRFKPVFLMLNRFKRENIYILCRLTALKRFYSC